MRDVEPKGSKRRYDTMLGFASEGRDCDPVTKETRESVAGSENQFVLWLKT
jgi:hypothetical protein